MATKRLCVVVLVMILLTSITSSLPCSPPSLQQAIGENAVRTLIETLRCKGHTTMALFLELHPIELHGMDLDDGIVIFAPSEEAVARVHGDLSPVLLRHVVSSHGIHGSNFLFRTFLPGFVVAIEPNFHENGDYMMINSLVQHPVEPLYEDFHNHLYVYATEQIIPPLRARGDE